MNRFTMAKTKFSVRDRTIDDEYKVIYRSMLPFDENSYEFEGSQLQNTEISFIWVDMPPGSGVRLHTHPYKEIFIIEDGEGTFTIGSEVIKAHGGQISIVPAGKAHKFINRGLQQLSQVDIHALIDKAGGSAFVYGISSGACLALEAAIKLGNKINKLALYEPPYDSDPSALKPWQNYQNTLSELIKADHRGEAVALFMRFVGTPTEMVEGMRQTPMWPMFEAAAPTLVYDAAAMGKDRTVPIDQAGKVKSPTLVMDGGADLQFMPFMHVSATALAQAIPHAKLRTLEGQMHDVKAEVLAPVLVEFFTQN